MIKHWIKYFQIIFRNIICITELHRNANTDDNKSETFDVSNNVFLMTINRLSNAFILFYRILLRLAILALYMQRILCVQRNCFLNGLSSPKFNDYVRTPTISLWSLKWHFARFSKIQVKFTLQNVGKIIFFNNVLFPIWRIPSKTLLRHVSVRTCFGL